MAETDESRAKLVWAALQRTIGTELNKIHPPPLSLEERMEIARLMAGAYGHTVRAVTRLAAATKELANYLDAAAALAKEIADLDSTMRIIRMEDPPISEEPYEWVRQLNSLAIGVKRSSGHLGTVVPEIVEQIGAIDTSAETKSER